MGLFDKFSGTYDKDLVKGDQKMEKKDFMGAAQAYRSALRKAEKKAPDAAPGIRTKLDLADDQIITEQFRLVEEHLEDGEPDVAREVLEVARNFTREHGGEYDARIRELEQSIKDRVRMDQEESHREYEAQMQKELRDKEVTEEIIEYEQALHALPDGDSEEARTYGPHFQKGYMALIQGEFDTAAEELELATHERPESALAYEQWGKALEMTGRSPEAHRAYRKSIQRDPRRREARLNLAGILDSLENKDKEAIEVLREGIDEVPDGEIQMRMSIGAIHLNHRRPAEAIEDMEPLLKIDPQGKSEFWHMIGTAHEMSGNLDEAERAYQMAYARDSKNPGRRVHFVEFCLRHQRSMEQAESAISSICQSCGFPGDPKTMATFSYYLAHIAAARGEGREALSTVNRALEGGVPHEYEERFLELKKKLEESQE